MDRLAFGRFLRGLPRSHVAPPDHGVPQARANERAAIRGIGAGRSGLHKPPAQANGSSVGLKTADTVLAFMGEPLFGPWFRCEVETFIAITGSKAHWLGHYAVNDPSFVSRLRRGASPRLSTVDRVRAWMGANLRVAEQLAIRAAVARRDGSRAGANGQAHRTRLSGAAGERTMKDHPEYLSTLEAASLLGVSARTLERFRVSGGGPPFCKFGHRVSYTRTDVDGWANSRRRRSTSDEGKD